MCLSKLLVQSDGLFQIKCSQLIKGDWVLWRIVNIKRDYWDLYS